MQTMKILFAALFLLVGLPTAFAADPYTRSMKDNIPTIETVEPTKGFAGVFIGGSVNWDRLDIDQRGSLSYDNGEEVYPLTNGFVDLPGAEGDEFSFGARIGYLFQVGRIYGGPVAMFDLGGPSAGISYDDEGVSASLDQTVNWKASLVGKLGVQVIDRIGVYGIVGIAFVDVDLDGKAHIGDEGRGMGLTVNHNETLTAFTYGFGVDAKVSDRWTAFAEWQRFDLDTFNANGSILFDQIKYGYKGDDTLDTFRVGVVYTFN